MALLTMLLLSAGCQFFGQRSGVSTNYNLPLTVLVRADPSIATATVEYRDACGQTVAAPVHDALQKQLGKRMGQVFERIHMGTATSKEAADGAVDVALGFREVNLFVPRKGNKSYPATVTLGLEFTYIDQQGAVLHSKKLQSSATGEVETRADTCDVSGLDAVAQEAVAILVEGMAQQLGTATKIREQAQVKKSDRSGGTPPISKPGAPQAEAPSSASPAVPISPPQATVPSSPPTSYPTAQVEKPLTPTRLSFRTIIRDDNQNHVLEQQEVFSVEFEVKNEGAGVAEAVEIDVSGHPAIVSGLKSPVSLGMLQPGEIRRASLDGKVGTVSDMEQAELICTLRASANAELPSSKKFFVAIHPDRSDGVEVLSVDVDQLPTMNGKPAQSQAIGIAIGVGAFRDPTMPARKFSAHDAEIMGGYFKTVLGIPAQKVRVVSDATGLKDDLIEVFEQWLPKQVGPQATAYVYVSGRAVVDQATGVVSLFPYDGSSSGGTRTFSLSRLQRAVARASVKQAVMMLDLSLEPSSGSDPGQVMAPRWNHEDSGAEHHRVMLMIGNSALQEAQAYQPGQHGLFTYFLLKGLRGAADLDKNGTVLTGELCTYIHGQVRAVAQTQAGNPQQTLCLPPVGEASPLRGIPVAKSH